MVNVKDGMARESHSDEHFKDGLDMVVIAAISRNVLYVDQKKCQISST